MPRRQVDVFGAARVAVVLAVVLAACSPLVQDIARASEAVPAPRWGPIFVYDPARDVVVLFGGASAPREYLGDTWTWDGRAWRRHEVTGPTPRGFSAACYHPDRGSVVIHGGRGQDGSTLADTWEWDGSSWHQLEATGPYVSDHHHMVYEPAHQRLTAFGGWNGENVTGATWSWDGRWQKLSDDGPPKRAAFGMAYDSDRQRIVVYGGMWTQGQYADVWEWDGRTWSPASGPYDRSSLDHHAMVYDARHHKMIVFGGKNYRYQALNTTWNLQGSQLEATAGDAPEARYSAGMTWDSKRQRVVLFGGKRLDGRTPHALDDLWQRDEAGWSAIDGTGADREVAASTGHPDLDRGAASVAPTAQAIANVQALEAQVRAALDTFQTAFRDGKVEVLERMITSNYMHCNSGSPVIGRDAWLEYNRGRRRQLEDGTLVVDSYETREIVIEIVGPETAVLSGLNINRGRRNGEPYESIVRFTQTWVLQDGRWERAAFHDTRQ